jgi:hypothetical protein
MSIEAFHIPVVTQVRELLQNGPRECRALAHGQDGVDGREEAHELRGIRDRGVKAHDLDAAGKPLSQSAISSATP